MPTPDITPNLPDICPPKMRAEFERLRQNWDLLSIENQKKLLGATETLGSQMEELQKQLRPLTFSHDGLLNSISPKTLESLKQILSPDQNEISTSQLRGLLKEAMNDPKKLMQIALTLAQDTAAGTEFQSILQMCGELMAEALEAIEEVLRACERPLNDHRTARTPEERKKELQRDLSEFRTVWEWTKDSLANALSDKPEDLAGKAAAKALTEERKEQAVVEEIKKVGVHIAGTETRLKDAPLNSVEYLKLCAELMHLLMQEDALMAKLNDLRTFETYA